jgi:hypothetical protein
MSTHLVSGHHVCLRVVCLVHPQDVFKVALLANAAGVIVRITTRPVIPLDTRRSQAAHRMRDDFTQSTKELLARRVNLRCSNPGCRKPTSGPWS